MSHGGRRACSLSTPSPSSALTMSPNNNSSNQQDDADALICIGSSNPLSTVAVGAGWVSLPVVWVSLYFVRTSGADLPAGVSAGDVLLGLASDGVHSNGYSLVRKLVEVSGLGWDAQCPWAEGTLGQELLTPTRLASSARLLHHQSTTQHPLTRLNLQDVNTRWVTTQIQL